MLEWGSAERHLHGCVRPLSSWPGYPPVEDGPPMWGLTRSWVGTRSERTFRVKRSNDKDLGAQLAEILGGAADSLNMTRNGFRVDFELGGSFGKGAAWPIGGQ